MFKIISITLISTFFLFANETFKSIEELSPNDKQIKEMIEKEQLEEKKVHYLRKLFFQNLKYMVNKNLTLKRIQIVK